jgi:hypothetical protein
LILRLSAAGEENLVIEVACRLDLGRITGPQSKTFEIASVSKRILARVQVFPSPDVSPPEARLHQGSI